MEDLALAAAAKAQEEVKEGEEKLKAVLESIAKSQSAGARKEKSQSSSPRPCPPLRRSPPQQDPGHWHIGARVPWPDATQPRLLLSAMTLSKRRDREEIGEIPEDGAGDRRGDHRRLRWPRPGRT
eukprot:717544-Hanusia_phi.AAC.1